MKKADAKKALIHKKTSKPEFKEQIQLIKDSGIMPDRTDDELEPPR